MRPSLVMAAGAAIVAAGITPTPARAQTQANYDLVWEREQGAETCPDRATFVDSIRTRLGYDPFQQGSVRRLQIRLSRAPARWRAELRVLENGLERGSQRLEAEGPDCAALFAAIVAVASVTLDHAATPAAEPSAQTLPAASEPEPAKPEPPPPVVVPNSAPPGAPRERHQRPREHEEPPVARWALGLEFAQDLQLIGDKNDVCGWHQNQSLACFEQDGTLYAGISLPGWNNRVAGGLLYGNPRLLSNLQYLLTERFAVEIRFGWAFGGGPSTFFPGHFETGVRYWLAGRSSRLRGYVGAGVGVAQFDAKFRVTVQDCGSRYTGFSTDGSQCLPQGGQGTPKTLDVYQSLGLVFVPLRIGAAWSFADDHALTVGLATSPTFGSAGVVFDPTIGYSAAF